MTRLVLWLVSGSLGLPSIRLLAYPVNELASKFSCAQIMHTSYAAVMQGTCKPNASLYVQVEKVDVLLSKWTGPAAILLNAEWTPETVNSQHKAFVKSFESIYSFLPLAIKVRGNCDCCLLSSSLHIWHAFSCHLHSSSSHTSCCLVGCRESCCLALDDVHHAYVYLDA